MFVTEREEILRLFLQKPFRLEIFEYLPSRLLTDTIDTLSKYFKEVDDRLIKPSWFAIPTKMVRWPTIVKKKNSYILIF